MRGHSLRGVPVVAAGGRFVAGVDLSAVADLIGIRYDAQPALDAATLLERFVRVLTAASRFATQIPESILADKLPNRDRSYLALLNHLVEIAAVFLEVADGASFDGKRSGAVPAVDLPVPSLIARANDLIEGLGESAGLDYERMVDTYYGEQTLHAVLERSTWHAAQHARQVMMVLEILGVTPERPLVDADFDGLPMPREVWDG